MNQQRKLQVGKITFTNILPVYHFFDEASLGKYVEFIPQVPAELNKKMKEGSIDLGPISAFAYGENAHHYSLLPNLSISSTGKVMTVLLFSKKPLHLLKESSIALTNQSATSINLFKIIMEKFIGGKPSYTVMESSLQRMMKQHDACILIGDDATLSNWNNPGYLVYDLGDLWYHYTGYPMTFAVWAVRDEVVQQYSDQLYAVYQGFIQSKQRGRAQIGEVIQYAMNHFGGSEIHWQTYFSILSYDFNEEHRAGLQHYYDLATEMGLLKQAVQLKFCFTEAPTMRING
ncbi:menaquinone biosynthetic enzyme MqnA/MqnD family protein [Rubeoparvulum massiliense]|uniref:menaquinone biosynthetic enzyme MqnA/MqnD family protein n=1 Tax=Rubeoparvulum massiliense TaxID=1631346 RepID=UPI00065E123D|nr:menaquinone biosynthesis protein [Rubeoparvulum massiliense]